ncbi:MAG TPA: zf-HC2 domain-containing protein [Polyangiaceae bacterium]|nr:zf-HC2 domain-containing protein [Polyangiaceae bacterium]
MTVVGLHPEELFDKLLDGELTPSERERLRGHLEGCQVCRFEYQARLDFQDEARVLGASSPPPLVPLRAPQPAVSAKPRRRSRRLVWGLAAAALISASAASAVTGQALWQGMSLLFSRSNTADPPASTASLKLAKVEPKAKPALQPAEPAVRPAEPEVAAVSASELATRSRSAPAVPTSIRGAATKAARGAAPVAKDTAAKDSAAKEPTSAAKLFAEANQARRAGDVGRASGLYHLLQDQFPGSAEAELSRVTLSLLLLDSGDAQGALRGFERYLAGGMRGLEAEALVGRARALGRLGRRDLEATAWQEVQRKYPRSIYGRQASERLLALGQP